MTTMTQCRLRNQSGETIDAWIESRGATVGKWVDLKGKGLYEVLTAGVVQNASDVYENERNFLNHRIATDI